MTINFSCPSVSVFYGENKTNREKLGKSEEKFGIYIHFTQ